MKRVAVYNEYFGSKGGGEKVCLALAEALSKNYEITLITSKKIDLLGLGKYFGVNVSRVKLNIINSNKPLHKLIHLLPLPLRLKIFFLDSLLFNSIKHKNYDLFINNTHQSNLPNPSKRGVYMCMFPQKLSSTNTTNLFKKALRQFVALLYKSFLLKGKDSAVYTYDLITANSAFTQYYVKKYWGLDSRVLYPICDSMYLPNIKKEKIILNVGRFMSEEDMVAHHKRQDFLIKAFKDSNLEAQGWKLYLAGSLDADPASKKYIEKLKQSLTPGIKISLDCSLDELKQLYNKAFIYWHATGYGSDPEQYPEKQEHFGITTVEAMSAGSIPIVFNSAGQKESITEAVSGFFWTNQNELIDTTKKVINLKKAQQNTLAEAAKVHSAKFNRVNFSKDVKDIFSSVI